MESISLRHSRAGAEVRHGVDSAAARTKAWLRPMRSFAFALLIVPRWVRLCPRGVFIALGCGMNYPSPGECQNPFAPSGRSAAHSKTPPGVGGRASFTVQLT